MRKEFRANRISQNGDQPDYIDWFSTTRVTFESKQFCSHVYDRDSSVNLDALRKEFLVDRRNLVLIVIASGWFVSYGIRMVYPVLVEYIRADFGASNAIIGLLFSVLMATYALMQFPSGILADQLGEKNVLLTSLSVTAFGIVLLTVSPHFVLFAVGCIVFGLGTGLYSTPQFSILSKVFPDHSATVHGVAYAAGSIGTFTLPVIAGYVALGTNWRFGFGFGLPLVMLVLVSFLRIVPRQEPNDASTANRSETSIWRTLRSVLAAVNDPTILVAFVAMTFVAFPFQGITAFLPTYLHTVKSFTSLQATLLFGLFFVTGTLCQVLLGNLADRFNRVFILLGIAVIVGFSLLGITASTNLVLIGALIVPLSAINAYISLSNTYLIEHLPDTMQGGGLGLLRTVIIGTGSLAPVSLGYLIDLGLFTQSLVAYAILVSSAAVLCLYLVYGE